MAKTISIGTQDFETIQQKNYFYIDKTSFIQQWWGNGDSVTLITRPRRFGKTLNMSMVEEFFSVNYANRGDLFQDLNIWQDEAYRELQGTFPVLFLSFADIKETNFREARKKICKIIQMTYNKYDFLLESNVMNANEKKDFLKISTDMEDYLASLSLKMLCDYLFRYYGKKVIILLDEYDTPMQEAYVNGYWEELTAFTRGLFNSTFKTNPYMERAIMTGITRVSKESIFSDLNNLEVVTTTSTKYADCFGFTEDEIFTALDEYGLSDQKSNIKTWYDGFTFGQRKDIYNPWSIINFLDKKKVGAYWTNTSSNTLIGKLIQESSPNIKKSFERLMQGESIHVELDEQIDYHLLSSDEQAIWSLLLASGYLKVQNFKEYISTTGDWKQEYELELTNFEVKSMFRNMIRNWFGSVKSDYNDFINALLIGDLKAMNAYMNKVTSDIFSYFDTGKKPSAKDPERFYHGFVLGLMAELTDRYVITSNRESGFGRYDIMLEPRILNSHSSFNTNYTNDAIIIEFKIQDSDEKNLSDTVQNAIQQIESQHYQSILIAKGVPKEHIKKYGFAFCGKRVLIEKNKECQET